METAKAVGVGHRAVPEGMSEEKIGRGTEKGQKRTAAPDDGHTAAGNDGHRHTAAGFGMSGDFSC